MSWDLFCYFLLVGWVWIGRWHCSSSAVLCYLIAVIRLCEIRLFRIQSRDSLLKSSEIMKAIVQSENAILLHLSAIFLLDNVWLLGEMICSIDTRVLLSKSVLGLYHKSQ